MGQYTLKHCYTEPQHVALNTTNTSCHIPINDDILEQKPKQIKSSTMPSKVNQLKFLVTEITFQSWLLLATKQLLTQINYKIK